MKTSYKFIFNRILSKILFLVFVFFSCCWLFACDVNSGAFVLDFNCFGSPVHVQTRSKKMDKNLQDEIKSLLFDLEAEFSVINGEFTRFFNENFSCQPINLSNTAKTLLSSCDSAYYFTNGKFNPLIYPLIKLWGFSIEEQRVFFVPDQNDVKNLTNGNLLDFSQLIFNPTSNTVQKANPNSQIDFGGILKGFSCDLIADKLISLGFTDGYVNVGSSSLRILKTNEFSIRNPLNVSSSIITYDSKDIENFSISTSGTYEKYHKIGQTVYSHIINPQTGYPTQTGVISATVVNTGATLGDALSTALCLLDFNPLDVSGDLIYMLDKITLAYPDAFYFIIYNKNDQKLIITNKKESENFTLLDKSFTIINR